jgi:hypothetical protein
MQDFQPKGLRDVQCGVLYGLQEGCAGGQDVLYVGRPGGRSLVFRILPYQRYFFFFPLNFHIYLPFFSFVWSIFVSGPHLLLIASFVCFRGFFDFLFPWFEMGFHPSTLSTISFVFFISFNLLFFLY